MMTMMMMMMITVVLENWLSGCECDIFIIIILSYTLFQSPDGGNVAQAKPAGKNI